MYTAQLSSDIDTRIEQIIARPFSPALINDLFECARVFDDHKTPIAAYCETLAVFNKCREMTRAQAITRRRPRDALICCVLKRAGISPYARHDIVERFRFADCAVDVLRINDVQSPIVRNATLLSRTMDFARNFRVRDPDHTLHRVAMRCNYLGFDFAEFTYVPEQGQWVLHEWFQPPCSPLPLRFLPFCEMYLVMSGMITKRTVALYDAIMAPHPRRVYSWALNGWRTAGCKFESPVPQPWVANGGLFFTQPM